MPSTANRYGRLRTTRGAPRASPDTAARRRATFLHRRVLRGTNFGVNYGMIGPSPTGGDTVTTKTERGAQARCVAAGVRLMVFTVPIAIMVLVGGGAVGADGTASVDPAIVGSWRFVRAVTPVEELLPLPGSDYVATFAADGGLHIAFEANRINTTYTTDDRRLTVNTPMMTTRAAWRPDSPAPRFVALMEHAAIYFFREGRLHIDTVADGGTLVFERRR